MTCNLHPQDDRQTQRLEVVSMPDPNAADAAASLAAQTSIEGVSLVPDLLTYRCLQENETEIFQDSSARRCNAGRWVVTVSGVLSNAGDTEQFCYSAVNDQVQCPQTRRTSNIVCMTYHTPPPQLKWDLPKLGLQTAPPTTHAPSAPVTSELLTVTNVTQDTALPHTPNKLSFHLQSPQIIAAGTPVAGVAIEGLFGLTIGTSPPYHAPQDPTPPPPSSTPPQQSQWKSKTLVGSSTRPGAYNNLEFEIESRYHLPPKHTLLFSGLTGSQAFCGFGGNEEVMDWSPSSVCQRPPNIMHIHTLLPADRTGADPYEKGGRGRDAEWQYQGGVAVAFNTSTGRLALTLPVNMSLHAGSLHRLQMGVLNGVILQQAPRVNVRTYNASRAFCGHNVSLLECWSRNEALEEQVAAGSEALLIRMFRVATAAQTSSAPLATNTIQITLRPWMDLDETNQITISGLKGVASLDQAQELQETWSRAPAGGEGGGGAGQSGTVLEYAAAVLKIHSWSGALGQLVLRIQTGRTMYAGLGSGYSFSFLVTNTAVEPESQMLMVALTGITGGQPLPSKNHAVSNHLLPLGIQTWMFITRLNQSHRSTMACPLSRGVRPR